ncbi:MAG: hypothetical protein RID07_02100, partial [Lacipirellulaceae bacterium]
MPEPLVEHLSIRSNWLFYSNVGFAIAGVVILLISWYYHTRIGKSMGARRLKADQARHRPSGNAAANFSNARSMWSMIQGGKYGQHPKKIINNCVKAIVVWLAFLFIWFGTLLYVEEQVKA